MSLAVARLSLTPWARHAWLILFLKLLVAAPKDAAYVHSGSKPEPSKSAIHILLLCTWGCMLVYMIPSFAEKTAVTDECAVANCSQPEHRQQNQEAAQADQQQAQGHQGLMRSVS